MLTIELTQMHFYAYHGCFKEEQVIGAHFNVDVQIEVPDTCIAITSDRLLDALNYQSVYSVVEQEMKQPSHLLEHVAGRIIKQIKAKFPQAGRIRVSISKLNPPLGGQVGAAQIVLTSD